MGKKHDQLVVGPKHELLANPWEAKSQNPNATIRTVSGGEYMRPMVAEVDPAEILDGMEDCPWGAIPVCTREYLRERSARKNKYSLWLRDRLTRNQGVLPVGRGEVEILGRWGKIGEGLNVFTTQETVEKSVGFPIVRLGEWMTTHFALGGCLLLRN